jgi:dCTP deaminase
MLLHDAAIRREIASGRVRIDPYDPDLIQPASLDVRLGGRFRVIKHNQPICSWISTRQPDMVRTELIEVGGDGGYTIAPGQFVLAATQETVGLPDDIAGRIEGKSSLGRLGLMLHSTAGWIDPGFQGQITLELTNQAPLPVIVYPGDRIGQLCLIRCEGHAAAPYGSPGLGSRYQHQRGPTAARQPGYSVTRPEDQTPGERAAITERFSPGRTET